MPVPTTLASLSTTAASNSPSGGENPFPDLDDHIRSGYAFDAQNRDAIATKLNASAVSAFGLTLIDDADAATARATLGAVGTSGDQTIAGVKTFSSSPVAPTPTTGDNTTKVATTAFVKTTADASATSAVADRLRFSLSATQATTSGTFFDFPIQSWAKKITVTFAGVSCAGGGYVGVRLGTGVTPTYLTTGYGGCAWQGANFTNFTDLIAASSHNSAADIRHGVMTLVKQAGDTWASASSIGIANAASSGGGGFSVNLPDVLSGLRVTTHNGDTFDGGSVCVLIEG